jgi:hypothetical protein
MTMLQTDDYANDKLFLLMMNLYIRPRKKCKYRTDLINMCVIGL